MNRWQSQNTVTRADYERIVSFNFRAGLLLPDISGSALLRKEPKKKPVKSSGTDYSDFTIDDIGDIIPAKPEIKMRTMSVRTARKIRLKINAMWRGGLAKTFCTLTMVNSSSDRVAIRCLQKLFKLWRDDWGKFDYLWTAERQENGRIHFHIILDRFINIEKENARWARLQFNSGIVYYKEIKGKQYPIDPTNMSNADIKKYLNPVDIEKIETIETLAAYLATYVTKQIGVKFGCQIWNCSKGVSALFTERFISTDLHDLAVATYPGAPNVYIFKKDYYDKKGKLKYKAGHMILPGDKSNDFAAWVYIKNFHFMNKVLKELDEINKSVIAGLFQKEDIQFYNYESYALHYQRVDNLSFKMYKKIVHSRVNQDCKYLDDFEKRGLDMENDFFQFGKSHGGKGTGARYSDPPGVDNFGQKTYGKIPFIKTQYNDYYN